MVSWETAAHTIVLSDIHLADAEPPHPHSPLWKRFKRPKHFIDKSFRRLLNHLQETIQGPIELVLNGDIFDFDSVMALPQRPTFAMSWLERARGLGSEEEKSRFKIQVILRDHPAWVEALRDFLTRGNRVVFVIGNHDIELHWPSVRADLLAAIAPPPLDAAAVRFCEWFYVSNKDTLIEHGNQYDAYCLGSDPLNPLIRVAGRTLVRIPFGNLAGRFMLNGMGLMNPNVDSSYIKGSLKEYLIFFYKYQVRVQPLLLLTWFWSATATLAVSITEGLLPPVKDPLTAEERIEDAAARANSTPRVARLLRELHVYPAIYNPFRILRELWLDRAFLFGAIALLSFQLYSFLNLFAVFSFGWFLLFFAVAMPPFIFYARSVESEVMGAQASAFRQLPFVAQAAKVKRVVQGHTHLETHRFIDGVEYLNTGTWSPAFHDVECMQPYGKKCFAWIRPAEAANGGEGTAEGTLGARVAELHEWQDPGVRQIFPVG